MRFTVFDAIFTALRRRPSGLTLRALSAEIRVDTSNLSPWLSRMVSAGIILHPRLGAPYRLPPIAYHPRKL